MVDCIGYGYYTNVYYIGTSAHSIFFDISSFPGCSNWKNSLCNDCKGTWCQMLVFQRPGSESRKVQVTQLALSPLGQRMARSLWPAWAAARVCACATEVWNAHHLRSIPSEKLRVNIVNDKTMPPCAVLRGGSADCSPIAVPQYHSSNRPPAWLIAKIATCLTWCRSWQLKQEKQAVFETHFWNTFDVLSLAQPDLHLLSRSDLKSLLTTVFFFRRSTNLRRPEPLSCLYLAWSYLLSHAVEPTYNLEPAMPQTENNTIWV